jgi:tetratricopeptide (TPR) repeat protein
METLRLLLTDRYINEAHSARSKANWASAEKSYQGAISTAPELAVLSRELGDIYVYEGKIQQAEESYRKAARQDPSDIETKKKLADLYLKNKQDDKAAALLKELASQQAQDEEIKALLDRVLAHSDPIEESLGQLRRRPQINRGDFGGLLAIRFPFLKELQISSPVILSDLKNHWAERYLPLIANLDLIQAYPNHQFRPFSPIRRFEVAVAVDQILALFNRRPNAEALSLRIQDVPRTNLRFMSISRVVALNLMKLDSENRFRPNDGISGEEALQLLDQIEKMTR